jgi:hypothetical protein
MDKRISLITSIFSDPREVEVVGHLFGDDAQTFVDVLDKVRPRILHQPPKSASADSNLNYCVLSNRSWTTSHHGLARNVDVIYVGFVAAML